MTKITDAQVGLMARAYDLRVNLEAVGVYPRGGQRGALTRLEAAGLMHFVGFGRCIDSNTEADVPIWEITEAGEAHLRSLGEIE